MMNPVVQRILEEARRRREADGTERKYECDRAERRENAERVKAMHREREYVEIEVDEVLKLTAKAVLIHYEGGEQWIPLSQVKDADVLEEGMVGCVIEVAEWFARNEEMI